MNLTRVLGALLVVVGVGWFLAVPALLPAAYHGHVHTGHEHAQYTATAIDPGTQSTETIVVASKNAADAAPTRNWTAVQHESLLPAEQDAFRASVEGSANATDLRTRERYRELENRHPFVALDGNWYELDLEDTDTYTRLVAARIQTERVTRSVAVEPAAMPGATGEHVGVVVRADGAVLLSSPAIPTPLYVDHDGAVQLVHRVGSAPAPPSIAALGLFLVPGLVLAAVGAYLGHRG